MKVFIALSILAAVSFASCKRSVKVSPNMANKLKSEIQNHKAVFINADNIADAGPILRELL